MFCEQFYFWISTQKNSRQEFEQLLARPCSPQCYSQQPEGGSNPRTLTATWAHRQTVEYYSALKRKGILAHPLTQMVLEGVILSEVSQTQKDTSCVVPCISDTTLYDVNSQRPKVESRDESSACLVGTELWLKASAEGSRVLCVYQMAWNCALENSSEKLPILCCVYFYYHKKRA